jgi:hypothetical protein
VTSRLHALLRTIDDDLVPVDRVVDSLGPGPGGLDALAVLLRADWLRLVSFERGIGPVLWLETPDVAIDRLAREPDARTHALVKMTPTGANAMRAMDEPPAALAAAYAAGLPTIEAEVTAVTALALVPAGLVGLPDPARPGTA